MSDTTSNIGAAIKGFVERIVNLKKELNTVKLRRKSRVEALKKAQLPAAELISLKKQDAEKAQTKAEKMLDAGALLGLSVYAGETEPESAADRGYNNDVQAVIDEHLQGVLDDDDEAKGINDDIKDVLKEAKSAGLVKTLVLQCAEFVLDPKVIDDYKDNQTALFDIYWKACE